MIDCKECVEYAHSILARGEITVEDVDNLVIDRHILKGCDVSQIQVVLLDSSKIPMDIICNGFSIKETIMEVLKSYDSCNQDNEDMAQDITNKLSNKLRIKQG
jgi:hypothetical protein